MDITARNVLHLLTILALVVWARCSALSLKAQDTQVCENEVFRARCPYTQQIYITRARYGHIEASRCVADSFAVMGYFGCLSHIESIVGGRCNGKPRCEIEIPDPEIPDPDACLAGLPMYLDVNYVCIPETVQSSGCEGFTVSRRQQYTTSDQIWKANCQMTTQDLPLMHLNFRADDNLKIKFTFHTLHVPDTHNQTEEHAFIINEVANNTRLKFVNSQKEIEFSSRGSQAKLVVPEEHLQFLVGFQAVGCDDVQTPPYTWSDRTGDVTFLRCESGSYQWKLDCIGDKWIGPLGNCTQDVKVIKAEKPAAKSEVTPTKRRQEVLSKGVLFALIIGMTLFLCTIVITAGYVVLKRAKYASKAPQKNSMELNSLVFEGEGTSSWTRGKAAKNGNTPHDGHSNEWQQSMVRVQPANGTLLPPNTQKYFILDRDDLNTLRV